MKLKGLLFRKLIKRAEKERVELPGIKIGKKPVITEIPSFEDETKVKVIYPLIEMFAYAHIHWDETKKSLIYEVIEPELDEDEEKKLRTIADGLIDLVEIELSKIKRREKAMEYLQEQVKKVLDEFNVRLTEGEYIKIMYYIYRDFIGLGKIEPLMRDPNIEDLGCDGVNVPIYVVHRKFGSVRTNVIFTDVEELREFVIKLAERCGRYVSYAEPILDGTLPDGSRVAATLAGDVATKGPTFSIRKFREKPFSPIELIELRTASPEMMAYLWYIVEHRASLLVAGGVASGKTSFLNSISMFIPPESKIVSIEDTRELMLPHEHWVPVVTRVGFGIPLPTGEKYGEITLFDLLRESFRQNPDYVIVGEVRGKEAYVMFQGMASGNTCWGTFHAGSVDTIVKRLITPPIELSPTLVETLDCTIIMTHAKEKGKSARRVREIVEIRSIDESGRVDGIKVFEWDPVSDTYKRLGRSYLIEKLARAKGESIEDAYLELEARKEVIEWMLKNGIKDYKEFYKIVHSYYKERDQLLKKLGIEVKKPTVPKEKVEVKEKKTEVEKEEVKEKRVDIQDVLSIFGFRFVKE